VQRFAINLEHIGRPVSSSRVSQKPVGNSFHLADLGREAVDIQVLGFRSQFDVTESR
jgi:hypothetical protein